MLRRYHGVIHLGDLAVGVDQETESCRIGLVLLQDTISGTGHLVGIAQQIIGKVEFVPKGAVFLRRVERGAQDYGILGCKVLDSITEPFAFDGSARCVGLGIPPQHDMVSLVLFQGGIRPILVSHGKGGCLIPNLR